MVSAMLKKNLQFVVTYHTTAEAMATERLCKELGLPGRLISAPRNVTADCGIAWCAPPEAGEAILRALEEAKIEIDSHYELLL